MVTLASLQSETWWNREVVTPELDWLGDALRARTGRPPVSVGTKGNERHLNGAHRSQEWLLNSRYCTNKRYTVQGGLTSEQKRHIAALDFTPGDWGSPANRQLMVQQTGRLIAAMKAGGLDGVNECFGTLNGRTVTGWNNVTNGLTTSDSSHLDHWHLSFDRRRLRDRPLMERVLRVALGEDDDMTPQERDKLFNISAALDTALAGGNSWRTTGGSTVTIKPPATAAEMTALRADLNSLRADEAAREVREVARDVSTKALIESLSRVVGVPLTDAQIAAIAEETAQAVNTAVTETREQILVVLRRQEIEHENALQAALNAERATG